MVVERAFILQSSRMTMAAYTRIRAGAGTHAPDVKKGPPARSSHYDVLDGQRGVAALLVLLGHASFIEFGGEGQWVERSMMAVTFFFMLSGLVVASAYQRRMETGMTFKDFMIRRVIRLYPLMTVGTLAGAAWFAAFDPAFWLDAKWLPITALNLAGLPSMQAAYSFGRFPLNPPAWSLFYEMAAYAAYAAVIARLSVRPLIGVTVFSVMAYMVADWHYASALPLHGGALNVAASFCLGVLVWRLRPDLLVPKASLPSWVLALALCAICLCPIEATPLVDYLGLLVVFPGILIAGLHRGPGTATRFERIIGDLSFPVYIIHWPILLAAHRFISPVYGPLVGMAFAIMIAIATAWLLLRFYDEPVRAWLSSLVVRWSSRRSIA